jgi:hypothetical protein
MSESQSSGLLPIVFSTKERLGFFSGKEVCWSGGARRPGDKSTLFPEATLAGLIDGMPYTQGSFATPGFRI